MRGRGVHHLAVGPMRGRGMHHLAVGPMRGVHHLNVNGGAT